LGKITHGGGDASGPAGMKVDDERRLQESRRIGWEARVTSIRVGSREEGGGGRNKINLIPARSGETAGSRLAPCSLPPPPRDP
jgi:hypothetical protein